MTKIAGYDGRRLGQCALIVLKYLLPTDTIIWLEPESSTRDTGCQVISASHKRADNCCVLADWIFEALETRAWLKLIAKWKKSHGARLERSWRSLVRQSIREFKKLRLVLQRKRLFKIVLRSELRVLLLFYVCHVVRSGRSITLLNWNERLFT